MNLQVAVQSETHKLLEQGQVNACISSESEAMPGCKAHFIGQMHYRMVATPAFVHSWFRQGIHREALRKAPAVIYNDQDHLHSHLLLAQFGLNQQCFPFHYIPPQPPLRMLFFWIRIRFGARLSNCGPDSKWDTDRNTA